MGFPFGAVIGAGISAVGKLIGGRSSGQTQVSTVDYEALRDAAIKGGFNPLTALRAGGAAGFQVTHHPALSSVNIFGRALDSFGGTLMDADFGAEERAEKEMALLGAQIGLVQAQTKRVQSLDVPAAQGSRFVSGGAQLAGGLPKSRVDVMSPGGEVMDFPNPDFQAEPETDMWSWFRELRFGPALGEVVRGNVPSMMTEQPAMRIAGRVRQALPPLKSKPVEVPLPGWMDQRFGPMIPQ